MANKNELPPCPREELNPNNPIPFPWRDWFNKVYNITSGTVSGVLKWVNLNFAGSNLTDIVTRNHNDLQNIQGGSVAERYHLTAAEYQRLGIVVPGLDGVDGEDAFSIPGPVGATGLAGRSGIDGLDGEEGECGIPGPKGLQGIQGIPGIAGIAGFTIPGNDGEDGLDSFIPGPTGPQGVPGGGAAADIATTVRSPAVDESLAANLSAIVSRKYTIALGKKLSLGSGSIFRIL